MHRLSDDALTVLLVLDHAFVSGGQARVAFDSALGLKRAGHTPIVFAATGPVEPELVAAGIRVVCLDQSDLLGNPSKIAAAMQGIWNQTAERALKEVLQSLPAERTVVHVHGWAKALSPSIALPIAASGLPAVYTMHEYFLLCPNGGFYNYRQGHTCSLDPLSAACWATNCDSRNYARKLWRNLRQVVMTRAAELPRVFSAYVLISRFQQEAIGRHLPANIPVHLVSNPIAAVDLGPKENPASGDVLFVGRISPEKGPFLFAEAARILGRSAVYIGDGPAAAELQARYPEARVLGWQDQSSVRALMRQARALVFPSLWYEGQPLTVLEAKSLGTPVIIADGCAGRDDIEHDVAGLWFRSGDVESLAAAIASLDDDETVARLSFGAYRAFWNDPPTIERHVRTIVDLYRELTGAVKPVVAEAA